MEAAPVAGAVNLQATDAEALCETCHGDRGDAKPCRHASDLLVGNMNVAEGLQSSLKNGKVVCSTCHDIVYQCENARIQYSYQNPGFLRDRTSRNTGSYCMNCHDATSYEKLNPHDGIAGIPPKPTCMLCHENIPETGSIGSINAAFNMKHDLNDTCRGCHNIGPHPTNLFAGKPSSEWVHLAAPSPEIEANLRKFEAENGIAPPLHSETGEIYCSTCHNQHGFMGEPAEKQPKHRLRANDICQACHDK
jgi:hypothetical protein